MHAKTHIDLQVHRVEADEIPRLLRKHPELSDEMLYPNFFASPYWLEAVIRSGDPRHTFGLLVTRDGAPVALLPLEKARNPLGGSDFRYLGYRFHPDPLGLICHREQLPDAIKAIRNHLDHSNDWDRLILDYVLPEECDLWGGELHIQSVAPYLKLPESIDALFSSFNGKKRYKLRTKVRKAEDAGIVFSLAESSADKHQYLDALFNLHIQRSQDIGRKSSLQRSGVKQLHHEVVINSPEALLFALKVQNQFVAILYGFLSHTNFSFFQITHDPKYDELRPGTVILARSIERLCDLGTAEFNFLQGNESYKYEWASDQRNLFQTRLISSRLRPKVLHYGEQIKGIIRQLLKRSAQND